MYFYIYDILLLLFLVRRYQNNATGPIVQSTFFNNTSSNGGALYQNLGSGDITRCLFENNTAASSGGGASLYEFSTLRSVPDMI